MGLLSAGRPTKLRGVQAFAFELRVHGLTMYQPVRRLTSLRNFGVVAVVPSLNPLTLIQELIVEHGSATILGQNLAFVKDQLAHLQQQLIDLKAEVVSLKAEKQNLSDECQRRAARIHELEVAAKKKEEQDRTQEAAEPELEIMRLLSTRQQWTEGELAEKLKIEWRMVRVHLRGLKKKTWVDLVEYPYISDERPQDQPAVFS